MSKEASDLSKTEVIKLTFPCMASYINVIKGKTDTHNIEMNFKTMHIK